MLKTNDEKTVINSTIPVRGMKRVLLIVFSGTGNTLLVARLIGEQFSLAGWQADIVDITKAPDAAPGAYDLIGFGYPVYAFNAPAYFLSYIKRLELRGKTTFVFKTSGEPTFPNNASSWSVLKLLKNCHVLGDYHFLMPYNIIFKFPRSLAVQMYRAAQKISAELVRDVIAGKGSFLPITIIGILISILFKIQAPGARLNGLFYSVNRKKCIRCGQCIRECPTKNITLKNRRFRFGSRCLMCMRCSFFCPADAVRIGLLNLWRVNGAYQFDEPAEPFITEKTRGFYRIFLPWFKKHK
jgi:NAD-dependent dihydropyrimidine dehydrogenase PreA subunit